MSYWGLIVFSNILATLPFVGVIILVWLWCGDYINDFTIIKLFVIHVVLPFLLLFVVVIHFFCLHFYMSSDCFVDRFCFYYERVLFIYWFLLRDFCICLFCFLVCCFGFCIYWYFVFHEESFWCLDCLKAADKILPEWFFLLFFGFLKSIPDKFYGLCFVFVFFFCFVFMSCNLIFVFISGRMHFIVVVCFIVWVMNCLLCSFLALYVVILFPIWMEIQFIVCFFFVLMVVRLD